MTTPNEQACMCGRRAVVYATCIDGARRKVCYTCKHEIEATIDILDRAAEFMEADRRGYLLAVANAGVVA